MFATEQQSINQLLCLSSSIILFVDKHFVYSIGYNFVQRYDL